MHRSWWIGRFPLAAVLLAACGANGGESEPLPHGNRTTPLASNESVASATNSVVLLRIETLDGGTAQCTGAVIGERAVLTARHCVSTHQGHIVRCDRFGKTRDGAQLGQDVAPEKISVYEEMAPSFDAVPAARGVALAHPDGDVLCNLDVAVVLLDTPLSAFPLPVRLKSGLESGEDVRAVGYGARQPSPPEGTFALRVDRGAAPVLAVGSTVSASGTHLGPAEFEASQSVCDGDSGGPAISESTGAVVGVVSRAAGPTDCTGAFGHVYTRVEPFQSLITNALAMVNEIPVEEARDDGGETFTLTRTTTTDTDHETVAARPLSGGTGRLPLDEGRPPGGWNRFGWMTLGLMLLGCRKRLPTRTRARNGARRRAR